MGLLTVSAVDAVETLLDWRDAAVQIYSVTGQEMSAMREFLPQGIYILRSGNKTSKVIVQ